MKKVNLTLCAMLLSMATMTAWGQLAYTSNFYGQGYYRVFNAQSLKNLDVVSNVGDMTMKAINLAENTHALHSDAGSVVYIEFLTENDLEKGIPYGLYNIGAQGAGTRDITASLMPTFNQLLGSRMSGGMPLSFIPVNVNAARTPGEAEPVDGNPSKFQASFNLAGITALFRDNHGVSAPVIGDNFGFSLDATYAPANYASIANSFPAYDNYCNWDIAPVDTESNYYTPPYNNTSGDGYINDGTCNWATVYVDFPFILPDNAAAHKVDENGIMTDLEWRIVPAKTAVLLSWAGNEHDDVKLLPGVLTTEQVTQLSRSLHEQIKDAWLQHGDNTSIFTAVTTNYTTATERYGEDVLTYVRNLAMGIIYQYDALATQAEGLSQLSDEQFYAQLGLLCQSAANEGAADDTKLLAAMVRQMLVNAVRNKYFYDKYNAVFGSALATANEEMAGNKAELPDEANGLLWCGDYFAYGDNSALAGQAISPDGYYALTWIENGQPVFDTPVTGWNGNMAYRNPSLHTLNWIVNEGTAGQTYKVADKLQVAYIHRIAGGFNLISGMTTPDSYRIFAKDNDNYRAKDINDGHIDYMAAHYFTSISLDEGIDAYANPETTQSNWIRIDCTEDQLKAITELYNVAASTELNTPGAYANRNTFSKLPFVTDVQLTLRDKTNPQADFVSMTFAGEEYPSSDNGKARVFNTYIPANFYEESGNPATVQKDKFFFVTPKPNEIAILSWSVYDGNKHMFIPKKSVNPNTGEQMNGADLKGGYPVLDDYYPVSVTLPYEAGQAYKFYAVITRNQAASSAPIHRVSAYQPIGYDTESLSTNYVVHPIYSSSEGPIIVTEVENVNNAKAVAGVEYVNPAGMRAARPWPGVNIVVTRYSDGTTRTAKVIHN